MLDKKYQRKIYALKTNLTSQPTQLGTINYKKENK